jgi:outer membrane protein assembly factor BamB
MILLAGLLASSLAMTSVTAAGSDDSEGADKERWAAWRAGGDGIAAAGSKVPMEWNDETRLWKTPIEGLGHSSPVVWGNRIFVTTAIEGETIEGAEAPVHTFGGQEFKHPQAVGANKKQTLKVIAINADSGEILWSQTAFDGQVYDDRHQASSYASPTAVTDGELVYAYFGSEGIYAYDMDGEPAWKVDIGKIKAVGLGVASSPILYDDLLIIQADEDSGDASFIVALDKKTGKQAWKTPRPVQISWSTPLVVETEKRAELLTSGNEWIISYDPKTGKELWKVKGLENNAIHTPLLIDDLAIFTSGYPGKIIKAIRLGGSGDLTGSDAVVWSYNKGTAYVPSNILYDGRLYLTNDGGTLTCLNARNGKVIYEGGRLPMRGRLTASLIVVDGKILMINDDGDAAFVKTGDEHEILATTSLDEPVYATPAVVGNRLYVRGKQNLYAFGRK